MELLKIRKATIDDAKELVRIYAYYVNNTAITFEYTIPSIEEFQMRITNTLKKYPYFVAEVPNGIFGYQTVGYTYAGPFIGRDAYDWSAETTIYINSKLQNQGIGGQLYRKLEGELAAMGITNLYACVAYSEVEDNYLNLNSIDFHEHLGFDIVGRFHKCGHKFGKWYDMVWMEKIIGNHVNNVTPVKFYDEVDYND